MFLNQVENAGTIVISRTQQMSDEKLEACVHMLREHNEKAAIITTPWDQLDKDMIRNALDHSAMPEHLIGDAECGCHDHHHDHDGECCQHAI